MSMTEEDLPKLTANLNALTSGSWNEVPGNENYRPYAATRCLLVFISLLFVGCSHISKDVHACERQGMRGTLVQLDRAERDRAMPRLLTAIDNAEAMHPTISPGYRQLLFRSNAQLVLCELGPCLPTVWIFEEQGSTWNLVNRPDGICVSK